MGYLGVQYRYRCITTRDSAADICDYAGFRSTLVSRLAGVPAPTAQDVIGSPEQAPNGSGTTLPHMPRLATIAQREHVPHPVDIHVGARVRFRRQLLGMSQKNLAAGLGITFQQVQKFERGMNRIAAGRLYHISCALDVPISFFFDTLPSEFGGQPRLPRHIPPAGAGDEMRGDTMQHRETLNLIRAYHAVSALALRKQILDLVRSLAPAA